MEYKNYSYGYTPLKPVTAIGISSEFSSAILTYLTHEYHNRHGKSRFGHRM